MENSGKLKILSINFGKSLKDRLKLKLPKKISLKKKRKNFGNKGNKLCRKKNL